MSESMLLPRPWIRLPLAIALSPVLLALWVVLVLTIGITYMVKCR